MDEKDREINGLLIEKHRLEKEILQLREELKNWKEEAILYESQRNDCLSRLTNEINSKILLRKELKEMKERKEVVKKKLDVLYEEVKSLT